MRSLYPLLTSTLSAVAIPALYLRAGRDPARRRSFRERLGELPEWPSGRGIWLQAVSVGEVRQARTLLRGLERAGGRLPVALSTTTAAGREMALGAGADLVFSFPLDVPWIVTRALDRLAPRAYGTVETEIWPSLLAACGARRIPAFIVNGSISPRSAGRLRRWMGAPVREGLAALRGACMQTQGDAERILELGAPASAVEVTGDIKFDAANPGSAAASADIGSLLGIAPGDPVLVAGSTAPGEEAAVVRAWSALRGEHPGLRLVVAPRHPDRFDEAARAMEGAGVRVARRSQIAPGRVPPSDHAVLLDSMGELEAAYGLARLAFVGGSLVPRGGQNPLEPASLSVPVLFGPGMDNFRPVADGLVACGAAWEVADAGELARRIGALLSDEGARSRASLAAGSFVRAHSGALPRTLAALAVKIPELFP